MWEKHRAQCFFPCRGCLFAKYVDMARKKREGAFLHAHEAEKSSITRMAAEQEDSGGVLVINHLQREIFAAPAIRDGDGRREKKDDPFSSGIEAAIRAVPRMLLGEDVRWDWTGIQGHGSARVPAAGSPPAVRLRTFIDGPGTAAGGPAVVCENPSLAGSGALAHITNATFASATGKLHVGMITTRWVGSNADFTIGRPSNAIQGMPYVNIHNRGPWTVSFNEGDIIIPPGRTFRFSGRDHLGVRLGTVFRDDNGLYETVIPSTPFTDMYVGVLGGIAQPLFSGWQETSEFSEISDGVAFPLEQGTSGRAAPPRFDPSAIPSERGLSEWGC